MTMEKLDEKTKQNEEALQITKENALDLERLMAHLLGNKMK